MVDYRYMHPPILSCSHISKTFVRSLIPVVQLQEHLAHPRSKTMWSVTAVDDVSLSLARGEWVGLYGPNGCGKTTLLKLLSGIMKPDRGTVARSGEVSCFFELGVGFHDERSGEENVRMQALLQGLGAAQTKRLLHEVRSFADIGDHWDLPLKCYSTGMHLRLAFAVATASPADILYLDEIFAVGDQAFQERCWARLHALKATGRSALLVSHGMGDLERLCDRILMLESGSIREEKQISPVSHHEPVLQA